MLRLIRNQVGIEPIWEGDYSRSKLIITPETAKERCKQGIVKALGPDVVDIKIGDYVLFSAYDGTIVAFDGADGKPEAMIIIPEDGLDAKVVVDVKINFDYDLIDESLVDGSIYISYTQLMAHCASQLRDTHFIPYRPRKKIV